MTISESPDRYATARHLQSGHCASKVDEFPATTAATCAVHRRVYRRYVNALAPRALCRQFQNKNGRRSFSFFNVRRAPLPVTIRGDALNIVLSACRWIFQRCLRHPMHFSPFSKIRSATPCVWYTLIQIAAKDHSCAKQTGSGRWPSSTGDIACEAAHQRAERSIAKHRPVANGMSWCHTASRRPIFLPHLQRPEPTRGRNSASNGVITSLQKSTDLSNKV